ncbi:AAA family ATPase [Marine Group I thaumarchaeote]|uniref:AAA family ATPase n=1 Tax=Marine Group I thaumarchaeote TaxID=2511932 RepID=A0A7K4MWL7_9ARCH|nr:AAA family ATPase [Marine Group I thaumarchaeote]
MNLSPAKKRFVDLASAKYGEGAVMTRDEVKAFVKEADLGWVSWFVRAPYRVGTGKFKLPVNGDMITPVKPKKVKLPVMKKIEVDEESVVAYHNPPENLIPEKDPLYVPFGNFNDVYTIIKSGKYYSVFITGLSGNGKTFMVEQACAKAKREYFRVNITVETDEDDFLGHYALIDGNTVWQDGPVVKAMERGAILLLDEIDLASSKIMCLQPVLEGKGVYLKKVNRFVSPSVGFNVLATANTKGKGSEDGRFIGTNILNEAFLERFPITVEQEYPSMSVERKILDKVFASLDITEYGDFAEKLVTWADIIRKTFYEGGIDEIIATRRLVHIVNAYAIFGDRKKAIEMCIARFDDDTKTSFLDLYSKCDSEVVVTEESTETVEEAPKDEASEYM